MPVDCFFLSDFNDDRRDAALQALQVWRVGIPLREVYRGQPAATPPLPSSHGDSWAAGGVVHRLPPVAQLTRGLIRPWSEVGAVGPVTPDDPDRNFLLGDPIHASDIAEGRVVTRTELTEGVLPAVRGAVRSTDRTVRFVYVTGRAGAGVSTILCQAAYTCANEENRASVCGRNKGRSSTQRVGGSR